MVAIPLFIFLLLYLLIVLVFLGIFFIHIYHLVATSSVNLLSTAITVFVGGLMAIIIGFTFILLADVDWSMSMPLLNPDWFPGVFSPNTF